MEPQTCQTCILFYGQITQDVKAAEERGLKVSASKRLPVGKAAVHEIAIKWLSFSRVSLQLSGQHDGMFELCVQVWAVFMVNVAVSPPLHLKSFCPSR